MVGRNIIRLSFSALLLLTICRYSPVHAQNSPDSPVRIGIIQSLTGIAQEDGQNALRAIRLAADNINKTQTPKIELVVEDDGSVSKNTVTAFQKLKRQNVEAIIGATWDFTTNAIIPLAAREQVVLLNSTTLPEALKLDEANDFAFNNALPIEEEMRPFEEYLQQKQVKSIAVFYVQNSWGEIQRTFYAAAAKKHSVQIVEEVPSASYEDNDWRIILPRVKSKGPDALVLLLNKNDIELVLRRTRELAIKTSFFSSKNTYAAFKSAKDPDLYAAVCFTYPYKQLKQNESFYQQFEAVYSQPPLIYTDSSYDAAQILHAAIRQAREKHCRVSEILKTVEFSGIVGSYKYSPQLSLANGTSSLVCVKKGELTLEP
jgi:branched-chain amino acid transport system substrate-binding protein